VASKVRFETIDRFVDVFEMVLYQHKLTQDDNWEACLISSLQHSIEKMTWFKMQLMDKHLTWAAAKSILKKQYGGDHSLSWYLEKLTSMTASRHENPAKFVEKFCTVLRGAAVEDSVGFGSILIKALANHSDLVKQVKATYASTDATHRPVFNVAYIARVVPLLYIDNSNDNEEDHPKKRQRNNGQGHQRPQQRSNNNGSNHHHNKNGHHGNGNGKHNFVMKSNNCRHCHQPWKHGHHCKEFFQNKQRQADNDTLRARMAVLEQRLETQEVADAMRKIDLGECKLKSRMAKIKDEEERLTLSTYYTTVKHANYNLRH
ncbi:hypothetical protein, partial, partial [Absidia glauca]